MGDVISQAVQAGESGAFGALMWIPLVLGIFWFLVWKPNADQRKSHEATMVSLKKGEEVVLTSGIIGKIHSVEEKTVMLEIDKGTRMKVLKAAITTVVPSGKGDTAKTDDEAPAKDEKSGDKKSKKKDKMKKSA